MTDLPLTKLSETATTITLGWTPPAGVQGYQFWADTRRSTTMDATRSSVRFAKGASKYRVQALGLIAEGSYPPAAPPQPVPTGRKLSWKPPGYPDYAGYKRVVIDSTHSNDVTIDQNTLITFSEPYKRDGGIYLWMTGVHNVVVMGGEIQQNADPAWGNSYNHGGIRFRGPNWDAPPGSTPGGTMYVEGLLIGGTGLLDGFAIDAPNCDIVVQNCRVATSRHIQDGHPDILQTQGDYKSLKVDGLTGFLDVTADDAHGIFIKRESTYAGPCDIRNVDVHRTWQSFWVEQNGVQDVTYTNCYAVGNRQPFGRDVWPQTLPNGLNGPRAVLAPDGKSLTFAGTNIYGTVTEGLPPGGEFVPAGMAGMNYVSPGYV